MGSFILGRQFLPYTVTASSSATDHPPTNVQRYDRPQITWRQGGASGDSWLRADFTTPPTAGFLHHTTAPQVVIEQSPTGSTWSPWGAGTYAIPFDRRVGRRKLWVDFTGLTNLHLRYRFPELVLEPGFGGETPFGDSGFVTADEAPHFEVGVLAFFAPVVALTAPPWFPMRYTPRGGGERLPFLAGNEDVNDGGLRRLETRLTIRGEKILQAMQDEAAEWAAVGQGDLIALAELYADEPWRVILGRIVGDDQVVEEHPLLSRPDLFLREAA